jgi:hypothetical protein
MAAGSLQWDYIAESENAALASPASLTKRMGPSAGGALRPGMVGFHQLFLSVAYPSCGRAVIFIAGSILERVFGFVDREVPLVIFLF